MIITRKIFIVLSFFLIAAPLFSVSPDRQVVVAGENSPPASVFALDLKTELIIGAAIAGLFIPQFFIDSEPGNTKSKNDINFLDWQFMYSYNRTLDTIGTIGTAAALVLPMFSVIQNINNPGFLGIYAVMYAEAFLLTMATKDLFKVIASRHRPYTYFSETIPSGKENNFFHSFPSGHTSYAFLGAAFLATTFSREHPDSRWKIPLIVGSYSLATAVGVSRIASGNHFVTDVLAGALIGSFYGWLIPTLHLRQKNDVPKISVMPIGNSLLFSVSF
ncbi:MAG: phosphatase PAP2 family protein [Spirochaetes bacterium]|nr:phosphatase PAP2 family protein [Spirochaetota bacterium]